MAGPLGVGQAVARREHLDQAGLVARAAVLVDGARGIERRRGIAQRGDSVMQRGLVGLDLSDQMNAAGSSMLEGFFLAMHGVDSDHGVGQASAPIKLCTAGISLDLSS